MKTFTKMSVAFFAAFLLAPDCHAQDESGSEIEELQEAVAVFEFKESSHPVSNNDYHDGDILTPETIYDRDIALTISPRVESRNTENRFWLSGNNTQLRMYSGTLTFEAIEGTIIKSIAFEAKVTKGDFGTCDTGVLNAYDGSWVGEATKVVINLPDICNIQINCIRIGEATGLEEGEYEIFNTIAGFKSMPLGTWGKLQLDGAKVTSNSEESITIEDETGAIRLKNSALGTIDGNIISGLIGGKYIKEDKLPIMLFAQSTDLTATTGTVEPTLMSIADLIKEQSLLRYVKTGAVKIENSRAIDNSSSISVLGVEPDIISAESIEGFVEIAKGYYVLNATQVKGAVEDVYFWVDPLYYHVTSTEEKTVEVLKCRQDFSGELIIPETVEHDGITYTVTSIAAEAFQHCVYVTRLIISETVVYIGDGAFDGCSGLTYIYVPISVSFMGTGCFSGCISLGGISWGNLGISLVIEIGVVEISAEMITVYNDLTAVTLPATLKSIGEKCFYGCFRLMTVTSKIEDLFSISDDTFADVTYQFGTLIVPDGTKSLYESTPGWKNFRNIVEQSTVGITPSNICEKNDASIFTLSGQKVKDTIRKGLYIINCKKTIVR